MSKNELVSLALIYGEPRHAYALNAIIKEMGLEYWAKISPGRQRLSDELKEAFLAQNYENPFYLAANFAFGLSADDAIHTLRQRIKNLQDVLDHLTKQLEYLRRFDVRNSIITVASAQRHIEVEITASKDLVALFEQRPDFYTRELPGLLCELHGDSRVSLERKQP